MSTTHLIKAAATRARQNLMARSLGVHPWQIEALKQAHEHLAHAGHGRTAALLGDIALTKSGYAGSFEQQLCHRLWRSPEWSPALDELAAPALDALAHAKIASLHKQAAGAGSVPVLASMLGSRSEGVMGLLGSLVALGGTAGAGLGALNWHLNRETEEDDDQNENLKARADFLRDTASQIHNDLRMKQWKAQANGI